MLGDLMDKLLVIVFSYAWFGVEAYNRIQQRKRRDRTAAPADRGSLVLLYVCIAIGYGVAIAVSFAPLVRLPGGQPFWLLVGAACIAGDSGFATARWLRSGPTSPTRSRSRPTIG